MKKLFLFFILVVFSLAETSSEEYALFKRTISPSTMWGEDSIILVPQANTLGRGHLYLSSNTLDAGKIQGDKIYLTAGTVMFSTSDDVEVGYTRRVFVWDNLDYTNIKMDTWHLKARVFHLTNNFIPQIAVGVNLVSLSANDFSNEKDILYNPYVVATVKLPLFTNNIKFEVTAGAEKVYNENESTDVTFSGGLNLNFYKTFYLLAEIQGIDKDGNNGVINLGAKVKLGWVSLGAGMFNIARNRFEVGDNSNNNRYWMANLALDIPFEKLFK